MTYLLGFPPSLLRRSFFFLPPQNVVFGCYGFGCHPTPPQPAKILPYLVFFFNGVFLAYLTLPPHFAESRLHGRRSPQMVSSDVRAVSAFLFLLSFQTSDSIGRIVSACPSILFTTSPDPIFLGRSLRASARTQTKISRSAVVRAPLGRPPRVFREVCFATTPLWQLPAPPLRLLSARPPSLLSAFPTTRCRQEFRFLRSLKQTKGLLIICLLPLNLEQSRFERL